MSEDLTYRRPVPIFWWVKRPSYFLFVMRELSSIFIAWLVIYLCFFIRAVGQGEEEYQSFLDKADTPWLVTVNLVAFAFVVLHTVTWFMVTPQAMVVQVRGQRVPASAIIGALYVQLAVVSAFVAWLVLR